MLDVREILLIMAEETRKRGLPVPVDPGIIGEWSKDLDLPETGNTILYTGGLYQLMPYINAMVRYLERLEDTKASGLLLRAARRLKLTDLASVFVKPSKAEVAYSRRVLKAIASLLKRTGVDFAYSPKADGYSGVLLYDLGLDEVFREHAFNVYEKLKEAGARLVITVDPHTTYVLREVYPEYIEGYDLEVKSYIEILDEAGYTPNTNGGGEWVIHDPCLYARGLGIVSQPRRLLSRAGYRLVEPKRSGRMTYCCGGPIESITPRLSRRIAEVRFKELREKGKRIVTLCPICYANLSRVAVDAEIRDISLLLAGDLD